MLFQLKRKFDSGTAAAIIMITDCYLTELNKYYIDLNDLLSKGAHQKGSTVSSDTGEFLAPIITAIKNTIAHTESALRLFENLKSSLQKIEFQEIFN